MEFQRHHSRRHRLATLPELNPDGCTPQHGTPRTPTLPQSQSQHRRTINQRLNARQARTAAKKQKPPTSLKKPSKSFISAQTKTQSKFSLKQSKTLHHAKTQHESATEESSTTYQSTLHHNAESTLQYATSPQAHVHPQLTIHAAYKKPSQTNSFSQPTKT